MTDHRKKQNRSPRRFGALLLSFVLLFSALAPDVLPAWAEEGILTETDLSYAAEVTAPLEETEGAVSAEAVLPSGETEAALPSGETEAVLPSGETEAALPSEEPEEAASAIDPEEIFEDEDAYVTEEMDAYVLEEETEASEENAEVLEEAEVSGTDLADAQAPADWAGVQGWINAADDGAVLVLEADLSSAKGDGPLIVPDGKNVTIDLNGHSIKAAVDDEGSNQEAFLVQGTLNLINSSEAEAVFTGSLNNTGTLKAQNIVFCDSSFKFRSLFNNSGRLELTDCVITENKVDLPGGIIHGKGGNVALTRCEISENENTSSGGILEFNDLEAVLTDCVIRDNRTTAEGKGIDPAIDLLSEAALTIHSITVTGNTGYYNPGIYVDEEASIRADGKVIITDNNQIDQTSGMFGRDLFLDVGVKLVVTGKLDPESVIGIQSYYVPSPSFPDDVVLTQGLSGNGDIDNFVFTDDRAGIGLNEAGEVFTGLPVTVSFRANGGSGSMPDLKCPEESFIRLPENAFTAPEGERFSGWKYQDRIYLPHDLIYVAGSSSVDAVWSGNPWTYIQSLINEAAEYGDARTITLPYDITAGQDDGPLNVPGGLKLTLDLHGHSIDRNRKEPAENGSVLVNRGTLTIVDSVGGGEIRGGNTTGDGGGIYNRSNLYLNGGTVTGNKASGNGGGIYNMSSVTMEGSVISGNEAGQSGGGVYTVSKRLLALNDGEITGNKAGVHAGGVWFEKDGFLVLSGKGIITGNTVNNASENVFIQNGAAVTVTSKYERGSLVGITTEAKPEAGAPVNITKTNKGRGTAAGYVSDDPAYGVFQELEDEAKLVIPVTVSFARGNERATGEMASVTAGKGSEYTAPSCGFDLLGGAFAGWYVNDDRTTVVKTGEKLVFNENAVLTAVWDETDWKELQSQIDHASAGQTIVLEKPVTARDEDAALHVPKGIDVILDLNGQTIDRNLKETVSGGCVIRVEGRLTIRDSSSEKTGTITGGFNSSNSSTGLGGGILIDRGGEVILQSGRISGNQAYRGGGILNNFGTLTVEGGVIENNTARTLGGGIDAINGKTHIKGGQIVSNTCSTGLGGGIVVATGSADFSGSPEITGNTAKGHNNNVYIPATGLLKVSGELEEAKISIYHGRCEKADDLVTVTEGLTAWGSFAPFFSDIEGCFKGYDIDGQLVFGKTGVSVTYHRGTEEAADDESFPWAKDSYLLLPECGINPEEGYVFKGWQIGTDLHQPGEKIQITGDTGITAVWSDPWLDLQKQIDEAGNGDTITLQDTVTASKSDAPLFIKDHKLVVIDLNGYNIDRGLADGEARENGSVFVVEGALYILNSRESGEGWITGGNTTGNGGGILNSGTLNLRGGSIRGNKADGNGGGICNTGSGLINLYSTDITMNEAGQSGGGVCVDGGHRFVMYGGSITGNTAGQSGGGVCGGGSFYVSGDSVIRNNTVNGNANNLYIGAKDGQPVNEQMFNGLGSKADIGITSEIAPTRTAPVTVIKNTSGDFTTKGLHSDDDAYVVTGTDDYEVRLAVGVKVTFEKGDDEAAGEMPSVTAGVGYEYEVPECKYTLEGSSFAGWMIDNDPDKTVIPGDRIKPEKDFSLTALWSSPDSSWRKLQAEIDQTPDGGVIVLEENVRAMPMDGPLHIAEGKNLTIDLKGHTIDRHLFVKNDNGAVMIVNGTLTVMDSGTGGTIKGANNDSATPKTAGAVNVTGGTFILKGGTIRDNWSYFSGGVHPAAGGTFIMEGGSIEKNEAFLGGAIMANLDTVVDIRGGTITGNASDRNGAITLSRGTLKISGSPVITGNTTKGNAYNVELRSGVITVPAALDKNARIGVYDMGDGVITSGFPGRGILTNFSSDREKGFGYTEDGEVMVGPKVRVAFDAGEGSGNMDEIMIAQDSYFILPQCTFTPPEGKKFDKWLLINSALDAGTRVRITKDTVFQAKWIVDDREKVRVHWSSIDGTDRTAPYVIYYNPDDYEECTFENVLDQETINKIREHFSTDGYKSKYDLILRKPLTDYSSMDDAEVDQIDGSDPLDEYTDIYFVMFKEQKEIILSVDPALCGTKTTETAPSASVDSASDYIIVHTSWIESEDSHIIPEKTLVGGQTAYTDIVFEPKMGFVFGNDLTAGVSGAKMCGSIIITDGDYSGDACVTVKQQVEHVPGEARKEDEKAATCTEAGSCVLTVFCTQDACGHERISSERIETDPALGHQWGESVYSLSDDKKFLIAERRCAHQTTAECTETEQAEICVSRIMKYATCEENGETTFESNPFINPAFTNRSLTLAIPEKTGHKWGEPEYTWAEDFSTVTAQRVCGNDASHVESETAATEIINEKKPTCTEDGDRTYLASFTNRAFEQQIRKEVLPAAGHNWDEPTYTWTADKAQVTAARVCQNDPSHTETETVDAAVSETPPSCEEGGRRVYTASFENEAFAAQTITELIPATGHDWDETVYTWNYDNRSVTATRTCRRDASHIESESVAAESIVTKQPTCTEKGETTYTAKFTNEAFKEQTKTAADIDAIGHDWDEGKTSKEATCTEDGILTYTCKHDTSHTREEVIPKKGHLPEEKAVRENEKDPTCTEEGGYDDVIYCTHCHEVLTRDHHKEAALGHEWSEWTETRPATEEEDGLEERTCGREGCGAREERAIPHTGHVHQMTHVEEVPASCTGTGMKDHYRCEKCGRYYLDEDGTKEVSSESLVIDAEGHDTVRSEEDRVPATCTSFGHFYTVISCTKCLETISRTVASQPPLGHDWSAPVYDWSSDLSTVTAERTCGRDPEHKESETVPVKREVTKEPTCTEAGEITYTAEFTSSAFAAQTRTEEIPAKGHDWDAPVYTWADDNSTVTAEKTCRNDHNHVVRETADAASSVDVPPTCTEKGSTAYRAEFEDASFAPQTKTVENLEPLGHDYSYPVYNWSDDNLTAGAQMVCGRCGHTVEESVLVKQEIVKKPTCTERGATKYTAEFEDPAFTAQTKTVSDISALGHRWDDGTVTKKASCEEAGVRTYTCGNDSSHTRTEVIDALGHKAADPVVENMKAADCTHEGGYDEAVYCVRCQKELSRDHHTDPALGHDWGNWEVVKEATEEEEGLERRTCERCGEEEERTIPPAVHEHVMKHMDEEPATCTAAGLKEHYECETCGRSYLDESGYREVDREELVIPRTQQHDTDRRYENRVEATCTAPGHFDLVVYCTNPDCGEIISRTVITTAPALGHKWVKPAQEKYIWSDDNGSVTAVSVCEHNSSHVKEETAVAKSSVTKEPTCTEPGEMTYTAVFAGDMFETQTRTEIIPKSHQPRPAVKENETAATCTQEGGYDEVIYCSRCKEELSREHHTTAEALGHDWDNGTVTRVATADAEGEILYTCRRDHSHTKTEKISRIPQKKVDTTPTGIGASFYPVSKKQTKNSIRVSWKGVPGATGYAVYGAPAGKGNALQLLAEQAGTVFDWRGLKKKTYYQVVVVAYNSKGVVAESQAVYAATKGGKYTNPRKLKVKKKLKLKKGKSKKLKVTQVKQSRKGKVKKYRKVRFVSSNPAVAEVNGKGKVKAKGKGTCWIYIYAQNGVSTKVKVTVK